MTIDRLMAVLAFALFTGFLAVVVFRVGRWDLTIAIATGLGLAAYDLWRQLRPKGR
jgi:hypothetical protein